jgi:hypothetical protein
MKEEFSSLILLKQLESLLYLAFSIARKSLNFVLFV